SFVTSSTGFPLAIPPFPFQNQKRIRVASRQLSNLARPFELPRQKSLNPLQTLRRHCRLRTLLRPHAPPRPNQFFRPALVFPNEPAAPSRFPPQPPAFVASPRGLIRTLKMKCDD